MKLPFITFASAFALSAALGSLGAGCIFGCSVSDCSCPSTPERPEPQGPLPDLAVRSYYLEVEHATFELEPGTGTIEVTGDTLLLRYAQGGVTHQVEYAITGPR